MVIRKLNVGGDKNTVDWISEQAYIIHDDDERTILGGASIIACYPRNGLDEAYQALMRYGTAAAHSLLCVAGSKSSRIGQIDDEHITEYAFVFIHELFTVNDDKLSYAGVISQFHDYLRHAALKTGLHYLDIVFFVEVDNEFGVSEQNEEWAEALRGIGFEYADREPNVLFFPVIL